mgnify:CR=1 FL=1
MVITREKTSKKTLTLKERREFLNLPIKERRRILTEQADKLAKSYESNLAAKERETWQGGDIFES